MTHDMTTEGAHGAASHLLRAVQAICESKAFTTAERVILIHLCVSAGALDADCMLSVGHTIAHFEMSGRTVRGALHRLTAEGYVVTTARAGLSSLYRVSSHKLLADRQEGC